MARALLDESLADGSRGTSVLDDGQNVALRWLLREQSRLRWGKGGTMSKRRDGGYAPTNGDEEKEGAAQRWRRKRMVMMADGERLLRRYATTAVTSGGRQRRNQQSRRILGCERCLSVVGLVAGVERWMRSTCALGGSLAHLQQGRLPKAIFEKDDSGWEAMCSECVLSAAGWKRVRDIAIQFVSLVLATRTLGGRERERQKRSVWIRRSSCLAKWLFCPHSASFLATSLSQPECLNFTRHDTSGAAVTLRALYSKESELLLVRIERAQDCSRAETPTTTRALAENRKPKFRSRPNRG